MIKKLAIFATLLFSSSVFGQETKEEIQYEVPRYTVNFSVQADTDNKEVKPGFLTRRGDIEAIRKFTGNGKGIKVGVVDTGLDLTHSQRGGDLEIYDGSNPTTYRVREAKDFTNSRRFRGEPKWTDRNSHGCIYGDDMIITNLHGSQSIKSLFEEVEAQNIFCDDGAHLKSVKGMGIYTYSLNAGTNPYAEKNEVEFIHKIPYSGDLVVLQIGKDEVKLTPWHPVYIMTSSRGLSKTIKKIRADKVKVGDRICLLPAGAEDLNTKYHKIPLRDTFSCDNCGLDHLINVKKCWEPNGCGSSSISKRPTEYIELNEDLAMLLGLILTDGYIGEQSVEFTSTNDLHIKLFNELSVKVLGYLPKEYKTTANARRVRIHSLKLKAILNYLDIQSGAKSLTVRLPEKIKTSPNSVFYSFLIGCIEGDGNIDKKDGRTRLITASDKFCSDISIHLANIGWKTSANFCKPSEKSTFKGVGTWHLSIPRIPYLVENIRVKQYPSGVGKPHTRWSRTITGVTSQQHVGYMYDFTVEGNHNYVTNGFIVSNTHVASTIGGSSKNGKGISGVASECELYIAKGLSDGGFGSESQIAAAIDWLISKDVDIINLSLGGGYSDQIEQAVRRAYGKGILVFAALGNDGTRGDGHPGNSKATAGIAAVDYDKNIAIFSSRSDMAQLSGYGVNVFACVSAGRYAALSGTSMATPDQAGLAALVLSHQRLLGKDIKGHLEYIKLIKPFIEDLGSPGLDREYGYGYFDINKYIEYHKNQKPTPTPDPINPIDPEPQPKPTPEPKPNPDKPFKEGWKVFGQFYWDGKEIILLEKIK